MTIYGLCKEHKCASSTICYNVYLLACLSENSSVSFKLIAAQCRLWDISGMIGLNELVGQSVGHLKFSSDHSPTTVGHV